MKLFKIAMMSITSSLIAINSFGANAGVLTFGELSTDSNHNIIADTVIGREYLRFDSYSLTYAQIIEETRSGGLYEGWSIADASISDAFINAAIFPDELGRCSVGEEVYGEYCGKILGWVDGSFGSNWNQYKDHYVYLSDFEHEVGQTVISSNGQVVDYDSWSSISAVDSNPALNFLMYRENTLHVGGFNLNAVINNTVEAGVVAVPEPASIAIFGLSILGMAGIRKRKKNK